MFRLWPSANPFNKRKPKIKTPIDILTAAWQEQKLNPKVMLPLHFGVKGNF